MLRATNNSFQKFVFVFCSYLGFFDTIPPFDKMEYKNTTHRCVVFLYYILSNGGMVSRKSDHGICMGLKTLRKERPMGSRK